MYEQQDPPRSDCGELQKYVVVCISDFCRRYGIRESVKSKFGLYNQVESIDEGNFERLKDEFRCRKRIGEDEEANAGMRKRYCDKVENSAIEGSTLEMFSQDLLWSQQEIPSELIVSEDMGVIMGEKDDTNLMWDPSMTILDSEGQQPPLEFGSELLRSEEFQHVSSPPLNF